ncbi:hypothetical protein GCM10022199_16680 [Marihabitans asiaticum]|uniref:Uncharacterized protein n=1 Tax=Marihabitans asiaticum TaxID=415218 RepID=A0A560W7T7_9MICO|nr:hypothetical protein [Marihabitans asiaticum]TWD13649.1 hypothetical protein FB557_2277 [Marihabitans asiaticum]
MSTAGGSELHPTAVTELSGDEQLTGIDATVLDFWRWAMSDLRMNNVRGYLAEFVVARAVGATGRRVEWDAYDLVTSSGVKVEVKASGYLQAWRQPNGVSRPTFRVPQTNGWDHAQGATVGKGWHADVYVFCLHTAQEHDNYDVLDTRQWDFYVLPRRAIIRQDGRSISLTWLAQHAQGPVTVAALPAVIEANAESSEVSQ